MPSPSKVYVIAATKRIADMVARGKVDRQSDYVYVHDWTQLQGMRDLDVYVYWGGAATTLQRSRMLDSIGAARRRGLKIIEVPESELQP
jgi:hypothetical protein